MIFIIFLKYKFYLSNDLVQLFYILIKLQKKDCLNFVRFNREPDIYADHNYF